MTNIQEGADQLDPDGQTIARDAADYKADQIAAVNRQFFQQRCPECGETEPCIRGVRITGGPCKHPAITGDKP